MAKGSIVRVVRLLATSVWTMLCITLNQQCRAESGITNTISGIASNYASGYYVGSNGAFNALILTNAGVLNAGGVSVIGNSPTSSNNYATVTGSGSLWSNSGDLYVGYTGSFNQLTIMNGGVVMNSSGIVGCAAVIASSNNAVLVTDPGSVWSNKGDLSVGLRGTGHSLTITNGGQVFNVNGHIGLYSTRNMVIVAGVGSLWNQSGSLLVGGFESNSLTISSGGQVMNTIGEIGNNSGASNNVAIVTGAGSLWSNSKGLTIGNSGSRNSLTISDGGRVFSTVGGAISGGGVIGSYGTASNNLVTVTDAGSLWSNSSVCFVGYSGSGNRLIITNGGQTFNTAGHIGFISGANSNSVLVSGSGSLWSNSGDLQVGINGSGNSLIIANSGRVFSAHDGIGGAIGSGASASNNSVTVTGPGSLWSNSSTLYVGRSGSGNNLIITNGGTVFDTICYIGSQVGAVSNTVLVAGDLPPLNATSNDVRKVALL